MIMRRISDFNQEKLLSFFQPLKFTIAVEALIDGSSEGVLWMDDFNNPSLGLLWDFADGVYLVSNGFTESMREAIYMLFQEEIIPEAEKRTQTPVFVVYPSPIKWESKILSIFSPNWKISSEIACFYERTQTQLTPLTSSNPLPESFKVKSMDSSFFNQKNLTYLSDLLKELESEWGSIEKFLSNGYGYCIIDENANSLASWAVIGNIARSCAELGIDTMEKYRKQGLATIVANQIILTSYSKNLTPHWYCFQSNIASVKLVEKLGFHKIKDFLVFVVEKN